MTRAQHHIIRRQVLDIELAGTEADGHALQRKLPGLCQDWLTPALEHALDRLVPGDEHWTIERLNIDAGSFRVENLERGLIDAVTQSVERYLREHALRMGSTGSSERRRARPADPLMDRRSREENTSPLRPVGAIERRSEPQSLRDAFVYFLKTGVLPWWFHLAPGKTLEDLIQDVWRGGHSDGRPEVFARVLGEAIAVAPARTRLVRQFSPDFLTALLAAVEPGSAAAVRGILAELVKHGIAAPALKTFSEQVWENAFAMAVAGERVTAEALIDEALHAMLASVNLQKDLPPRIVQLGKSVARERHSEDKPRRDNARPEIRAAKPKTTPQRPAHENVASIIGLDDGVFINCAGVVLLHPFLPRLFEAVGIAKDGKLLQPERALCLIHFLATGQRFAPEYDLLLPKLLCNVPLDTPVESHIALTVAEEEEASALLAAVIRHWDALGDTSTDGLRGTFLVRPGRLSKRGNDDVLQVEARSFDILLDRLPWGIGMIQLPWMEKILWVEWRF